MEVNQMNKDKALEIALEALELHGKQYPHMVKGYCLDAIKAIKEALKTKEWVGLTDDEVYKIAFALEGEHWRKIADTIEAKLKEKNI
jgi:hypothetical protein